MKCPKCNARGTRLGQLKYRCNDYTCKQRIYRPLVGCGCVDKSGQPFWKALGK